MVLGLPGVRAPWLGSKGGRTIGVGRSPGPVFLGLILVLLELLSTEEALCDVTSFCEGLEILSP